VKFRINQSKNLRGEGNSAANIPAGYPLRDLAARLSVQGVLPKPAIHIIHFICPSCPGRIPHPNSVIESSFFK